MDAISLCCKRNVYPIVDEKDRVQVPAYLPSRTASSYICRVSAFLFLYWTTSTPHETACSTSFSFPARLNLESVISNILSHFDPLHSFYRFAVKIVHGIKKHFFEAARPLLPVRPLFLRRPRSRQDRLRGGNIVLFHSGKGAYYRCGHASRAHNICHHGVAVFHQYHSLSIGHNILFSCDNHGAIPFFGQ